MARSDGSLLVVWNLSRVQISTVLLRVRKSRRTLQTASTGRKRSDDEDDCTVVQEHAEDDGQQEAAP